MPLGKLTVSGTLAMWHVKYRIKGERRGEYLKNTVKVKIIKILKESVFLIRLCRYLIEA